MKVARRGDWHEIRETTVKIAFEGEFAEVHTIGDNSLVLPTDTMKNTVYALASETSELEEIETFAQRLAAHFLANNAHVSRVGIEIAEHNWARMKIDEQMHPHSFIKNCDERRTTKAIVARDAATIESGVENLIVLKTTRSGFAGFIKDRYTTLPEATDRIFATSITANWKYASSAAATGEAWRSARETIIETFAAHDSLSVQHTLYAMGEAVLEKFAGIEEIALSMPNIHYLPVDLARLGLENGNQIFLPTDEPHGLIEARLSR
jgi:urate oxidase